MTKKEKHYEIIDYEHLIKETDFQKVEQFFLDVDLFRLNISNSIAEIIEFYEGNEIGEAKVLSLLYELRKKIKKKIMVLEIDIPEIANVEFSILGTLKDGNKILISKDFDSNGKIIEKYKTQLNNNLSLSLGELLIKLEDTISQIKNFGTYPDPKAWYPQLKNVVKKPKPKNETAKGMYEIANKNRLKKEAVIAKAAEIISEKEQNYITPKGACQRWLWVDARITNIDEGNARGWLDKAIEDGTLEKEIKKLSTD